MARKRLSSDERDILADLYAHARRTVDDLPYTDEFDALHARFEARAARRISKHDLWRALSSSRKARRLVRKER